MLAEAFGLDPIFELTLWAIAVMVPLAIIAKIAKMRYNKGAGARKEQERQEALQQRAANPVFCFQCKKAIAEENEENECDDCGETFCPDCYEKGSEGYCEACTEKHCTYEVVLDYGDDEESIAEDLPKEEAEKLVSNIKTVMMSGQEVYEHDGKIYRVSKIRKVYYQ